MSPYLSLMLLLLALHQGAEAKFYADLRNYSFEQYLQEFGLEFHPSELPLRAALFEKEIARVASHNAKNLSWKEGVNKFTAMTEQEKKAYFGRNKNAAKLHKSLKANEHGLPKDFVIRDVKDLPKNVDWRDKGVISAVKDQGSCGSCWAFASTATLESHIALSTGALFDLSTQQIAMCAPNTEHCGGTGACQGSTAELAFEYVANSSGLFQEYQYGYASYYGKNFACEENSVPGGRKATISGYVKLPNNNYTVLMNAVATVGPIAINVDATPWSAYESGVFEGCRAKEIDVNHVVVLVGYGEDEKGVKHWIVRNSWSPNWGESGFVRLSRYDNDDADEHCKIDSTPEDGVACGENPPAEKVCGTCGAIYDSSYPIGARLL